MTIFARYNNSGSMQQYMGAATGEVFVKGKHTDSTLVSYDGAATIPVKSNFEFAPLWLDNIDMKKLKRVIAIADRAQGLSLQARILNKNLRILTPYKALGKLVDYINEFDVRVDDGVMIQISGSESSLLPYWSLLGLGLDVETSSNILKNSKR
jgi:hypothetical protein